MLQTLALKVVGDNKAYQRQYNKVLNIIKACPNYAIMNECAEHATNTYLEKLPMGTWAKDVADWKNEQSSAKTIELGNQIGLDLDELVLMTKTTIKKRMAANEAKYEEALRTFRDAKRAYEQTKLPLITESKKLSEYVSTIRTWKGMAPRWINDKRQAWTSLSNEARKVYDNDLDLYL